MVSDDVIRNQLPLCLDRTDLPALGVKYEGKVRDCYTRGTTRTLIATDRISAFDVVLGTVPFKGQVLSQMAGYWFELSRDVVPNHLVAIPDPQVTVATECKPLPIEFVMRAYLTGTTTTSIWYHYERGGRLFCGHPLPDGMRKHQRLAEPLLTPTTKAEKGEHDQNVSRQQIVEQGLLPGEEFDAAAAMCARLFAFGQQEAARRGLILVDTKYELGRRPDGSLCFIDEIHTPDSSRYWFAGDYDARLDRGEEPRGLDKDYVRRSYVERGYRGEGPPPPLPDEVRIEAARRYIALYELVTGRDFAPETGDPLPRIRRNLGV
jgi:phosphoribosylaminoimidazole-succinocarboxamide synthase